MNSDYIVKIKKDGIVVDIDIDKDSVTKIDTLSVIERILLQTNFDWSISYDPNNDGYHIFIGNTDDE